MLSKAAKTAVSIALAVTACDLSRADKTGGGSEEPESHPRAKADEYKRNPNPWKGLRSMRRPTASLP